MDITEQLTHESRIALAAAAEITRLRAEVERLTAVVKAANAQAEHFERQWYLRGDEVEALRADAETKRGLLLWALYHHQGGSSGVGQPIRRALGIGQHDAMTPEQIRDAARAAQGDKP